MTCLVVNFCANVLRLWRSPVQIRLAFLLLLHCCSPDGYSVVMSKSFESVSSFLKDRNMLVLYKLVSLFVRLKYKILKLHHVCSKTVKALSSNPQQSPALISTLVSSSAFSINLSKCQSATEDSDLSQTCSKYNDK